MNETYQNKTGDESKKIVLKEIELHYDEFMTKFHPLIYPHTQHCHHARWQAKQFHDSKNCFTPGCILSVVDFSENYTFTPQTELQGQYYHSEQVAIFVQVTYRHAQFEVDQIERWDENERIIIKEVHCYISDDRGHDRNYVVHCFAMFSEDLRNHGINVSENWI